MKKTVFLVMATVIIVCSSLAAVAQDWRKIKGTSIYVHKIFFPKDNKDVVIVAADGLKLDITESGIMFPSFGNGYIASLDKGETFKIEDTNLVQYSVFDIAELEDNTTWIASIRTFNNSGVVVSTDKGKTWDKENIKCSSSSTSSSSQIFRLAAAGSKIYGSVLNHDDNGGFVYSEDKFENCSFVENLDVQSYDVAVSPINPNLVFAAADNSTEGKGGVYRSYDGGKNWVPFETGLENKRIFCVLPSSHDASVILCGADSLTGGLDGSVGRGIYVSLDTGKTWRLTGARNMKVYDIAQHPSNPKYLIAACGSGGVVISRDYGLRWGGVNSGLPEGESVRTVGIPDWEITDDGFTAFAGVFSSKENDTNLAGLYKSGRLYTDVEESGYNVSEKLEINAIYPSPAEMEASIKWSSPNSGDVNIMIVDYLGRVILDFGTEYYSSGEHIMPWYIGGAVPAGVYSVIISNGTDKAAANIVVTR